MCPYVPVCTGMYNFDISRTAMYPEEDVLVCTSTYHLVLPRTRGTGFQMYSSESYVADIGLYQVYTRYITGKFHFSGFRMEARPSARASAAQHGYNLKAAP